MPCRTEYCQECPVGQSLVRNAQWDRGLLGMSCGTEDCQECPVGQRTVTNVLWDRGLSGMSSGTEYCQECPVGQRTVSPLRNLEEEKKERRLLSYFLC